MRLLQHFGAVGIAAVTAMGLVVAATGPANAAVTVSIGGVTDPTATAGPNGSDTAILIDAGLIDLTVQALSADGTPTTLDAGLTLRAVEGNAIVISGTGLPVDDTVTVTIDDGPGGAAPIDLGTLTVGSDGTFTGTLVLPAGVSPGSYTLEVAASTAAGDLLTTVIDTNVVAAPARSMVITGERRARHPERVFVNGTAQNMEDEVVQARVKLRGETHYRSGSTRVVRAGEFRWTRITGKKVYVYFRADDGLRSNRVVIQAR